MFVFLGVNSLLLPYCLFVIGLQIGRISIIGQQQIPKFHFYFSSGMVMDVTKIHFTLKCIDSILTGSDLSLNKKW